MFCRGLAGFCAFLTIVTISTDDSEAGGGRRFRQTRARPRYVATQSVQAAPIRPMTGTFYPTPYMTVGGNGFLGETGYSPLSQYGDSALAMYGPMAALRAKSAPVTLATTSAGGVTRLETATGFSYPFLPPASPLVYPTRAQVRGSLPYQSTPPWWDTGHGWVDQQ